MPLTEADNIILYGCSIGGLTTELTKSKTEEKMPCSQMAQHMISRHHRSITIDNVYTDVKILKQEVGLL